MRIATWNVWHRFGEDYDRRCEAIGQVLTEVAADVVCLQEVWTEPGTGRSQAAELAAHLGLVDSVDTHRVEHAGYTFGNAILSAWPIARSSSVDLPPHPEYEEFRSVLGVELGHPAGPLQVFTTHLNFLPYQSAVRVRQVRAIGAMMHEWDRPELAFPQVLTGDLNADPHSDEVRMLTGRADLGSPLALFDAWEVDGHGPGATWSNDNPLARPSFEPDRRIDYVMVGYPRRFEGRGQVRSAAVFGDHAAESTWPSDHFGIAVDLRD